MLLPTELLELLHEQRSSRQAIIEEQTTFCLFFFFGVTVLLVELPGRALEGEAIGPRRV